MYKRKINRIVGVMFFMAATNVLAQADLPHDLQHLNRQFQTLVSSPAEQQEFQLGMSYLSIDTAIPNIATEIALHESRLLQNLDGLAIDEFKVRDLRHDQNFQNLDGSADMLDAVLEELRISPVAVMPYFCRAFKTGSVERELSSCLASVEELLQAVRSDDGRLVYMVSVSGEYWGPFKKVIVYVSSSEDVNKYARFEFDVIHEI